MEDLSFIVVLLAIPVLTLLIVIAAYADHAMRVLSLICRRVDDIARALKEDRDVRKNQAQETEMPEPCPEPVTLQDKAIRQDVPLTLWQLVKAFDGWTVWRMPAPDDHSPLPWKASHDRTDGCVLVDATGSKVAAFYSSKDQFYVASVLAKSAALHDIAASLVNWSRRHESHSQLSDQELTAIIRDAFDVVADVRETA